VPNLLISAVAHTNKDIMESDPTANAAERWVLSILFGGLLGALQNWFRRRSQQKQTDTLLKDLRPPEHKPQDDDLREALRKLSDLQQQQHVANINRISQLETQYSDINSDIQDLKTDGKMIRSELEGVRNENRNQTQLLQSVLKTVLAIRDKE
jgi:septal ring factor EnvC (AmiA/AmiB activator)